MHCLALAGLVLLPFKNLVFARRSGIMHWVHMQVLSKEAAAGLWDEEAMTALNLVINGSPVALLRAAW